MCPVARLPGLGGFLKMVLSLGAELGFDTHCQIPQVSCLCLAGCPHSLCPGTQRSPWHMKGSLLFEVDRV